MRQNFTLPFIEKKQIAQDTYSFSFDRTGVEYDFVAGQYNKVTILHVNPDDRGINRFFSITESPTNKKTITIITKIPSENSSTFKNALFNLLPGVSVGFYGPIGNFVLKEEAPQHVFLCGGIGITPFVSIARYHAEKNIAKSLTLIASFSRPEEIILKEELEQLSQKNPNVKNIFTITHLEESSVNWNGEVGRISQDLIKKYVQDISVPTFYIVGPPAMVDGSVELLNAMNINPEKIIKESFTGY